MNSKIWNKFNFNKNKIKLFPLKNKILNLKYKNNSEHKNYKSKKKYNIFNLKMKNRSYNNSKSYDSYKVYTQDKLIKKINGLNNSLKKINLEINQFKINKQKLFSTKLKNKNYDFFQIRKKYKFNTNLNNILIKKNKEIYILKNDYYISKLKQSFNTNISNYFSKSFKKHFLETIDSINLYKNWKNKKYINRNKLLKWPNSSKITLIFDLDETLIHSITDINNIKKSDIKVPILLPDKKYIKIGVNIRPNAKEVLKELSNYFQIVIFTASNKLYANPIIDCLDPHGSIISKRLFRNSCNLVSNLYFIKDLSIINKDISRILMVDNSVFSFIKNLDNGIPIIPFYENKNDTELIELKEFLIKIKDLDDVRNCINNYFKWSYIKNNNKNYSALIKNIF